MYISISNKKWPSLQVVVLKEFSDVDPFTSSKLRQENLAISFWMYQNDHPDGRFITLQAQLLQLLQLLTLGLPNSYPAPVVKQNHASRWETTPRKMIPDDHSDL